MVTTADRLRGFLWGAAVGDALGGAVNHLSAEQIRERFGPRMLCDLVDVGGVRGAASQHTQLLLFCCESLVRAFVRGDLKGIGPDFVSVVDHGYARWLQTQGRASSRWGQDEGFDGWLRMERLLWKERRGASKMAEVLGQPRAGTVEDAINDGRGCGALPVVSSVGLVTVLDRSARRELAEKLAAITHGHRDAQLAAGAMAELVDLLRWNSSLDEAAQSVEQRLYDTPGADAVRDALGAARRLAASGAAATPESIAQLGGGWAAPDALAIAVFCALSVGSVEERLLAAVNHSGDSDACGALCGQLLGTAHGAHAIPEHWRRRIELRRTVDAMADDLVAWFEHPDRRPSDELWAWVRYPGW